VSRQRRDQNDPREWRGYLFALLIALLLFALETLRDLLI
jgi:hypothetical protein